MTHVAPARARRRRHVLRADPHPPGLSIRIERGRARLPARRQRVGQVDDAEDDPRHRAPAERRRAHRRRGRDEAADELPHRARARDRAREPPPVRADDGAREPRDGRLPARRRRQGGLRPRLRALPAALRAPRAARGDALGRRAADGRDGPRADVAAEAAADGRAVDGPRADPRRAELRDHQAGARVGRRDARRRAERERLAVDRRPRLRSLDRPLVLEGKAADLRENEGLRKAYLGR